ncbi:MAG: scavenger receptor cysteine-rich domain-containing protein [Methylococcales symbiont of Iophon sp. n. MRB-2018]|nr:MAG: scavenger receptor cysteine-rich domain-containing protein [Methylococcales symbiont of Iophon sp. n. MRB-2018]
MDVTDESPRAVIVEICQNGNYSTICGQFWGHEEASVACTQLGYSSRGTYTKRSVTLL